LVNPKILAGAHISNQEIFFSHHLQGLTKLFVVIEILKPNYFIVSLKKPSLALPCKE